MSLPSSLRPPAFRIPAVFTALIIGAGLFFATSSAYGQASSRSRFLTWAYLDAGALVQQINPRTPLYLLGSAAILVPTAGLDPTLLEGVQQRYRGPFASYLDAANELGGPRMLYLVGGLFAFTLPTNEARLQDAAFTSFQSLLYAGFVTMTLKYTFGRFRPEAARGAYQFDPFSGNTSFPSGHTTAAFAIITPWVLYYPNTATYGLFALGTGTALARIALDKHWPTDVLTGAAIGYLMGRYLTRRHLKDTAVRLPFHVAPVLAPGTLGVRLRF